MVANDSQVQVAEDRTVSVSTVRPRSARLLLELEIQRAEAKLKRIKRNTPFRTMMSAALVGIALIFVNILWSTVPRDAAFNLDVGLRILLSVLLFALALVMGIFIRRGLESNAEDELEALITQRDFIDRARYAMAPHRKRTKARESETSSYFNSLVQINIQNLGDYYALVKTHTDKSYRTSTQAGMIGFGFIMIGLIVGLVVSFSGNKDAQIIAYLTSASGIITEFIAGVFFYLYNKTVRQLKEYHDSLLEVQNILLSFKIVGDTSDPAQQATMVSQMISSLLNMKSP